VPIHDPEVILAATLRDEGLLKGVACPAPPTWAATICWDKLETARWLSGVDAPTPETRAIDDVDAVGDGWIVKPRRGVGSVGVARITTDRELADWRADARRDEYLAQRLLDGPELTLDGFLAADGSGRVVCRERIEVKSGVCTKARIFEDEMLAALALDVGRKLELRGAFCFQVMQDGSGAWLLTDVNPRTGAGTRLSAAVGVNLHAAMLADLWGLDPQVHVPRLSGERWVARYYREAVLQ
jgi:carbamoylphosphate synthase large subunit